ncbi:MAG: prolyl oligopeptidase family serine peptidase [Longimicrobiales bacterium]
MPIQPYRPTITCVALHAVALHAVMLLAAVGAAILAPQGAAAQQSETQLSAAQQSAAPESATPESATPESATPQPEAPFTIEDVLSSPMPSGLVAAPSGDRVAWVRNDRGVRNIWVATAPDWRARPVTTYSADIGVTPGGLEFTPDGRQLLYGVGGSPNRFGDYPNPASLAEPPEQALYAIDLETGERRPISRGGSRALSPDGTRYLITRGDEVLVRPLAGDTAVRAEPFFTVRRGASSLTWSPDGERVAFVSRRGDHSFVGVYDPAADAITWMAPSVDHDRSPVWSPDGERLAFLRVPNARDRLPFIAQPTAQPWSIWVADPATGAAAEVWRADPGPGSAFHSGYGRPLIWTPGRTGDGAGDGAGGDHLIFPWEKNGWLQLWSLEVPAAATAAATATAARAGRTARADAPEAAGRRARSTVPILLTPGELEVQWHALTADSTALLLSTNQGDIDRRHIWRVPVDGSETPVPVTQGDGIEWEPVSLDRGVVAFLASGPTTPARAEIRVDGRRRALVEDGGAGASGAAAPPSSFPAEHMVTPEPVVFPAADGLEIHGQLFLPPDRCGAGPHPGLLFFHGGSRRQMLLGFHHRGYYHNAYAFNQYTANRCVVVLSVNYRSGVGYGLDFREAEDYGAGGGSELNDVIGAGLFLADHPQVDAGRVGLWGGSYGGYLTAMGLARAPELFAAGVDLHGVHDWNVGIANFVDYEPEARPEVARIALESSPMHDLSRWEDPVLLIHGDDDRNVRFSETVDLTEELRARDVPVEHLVLPDEVHGFILHESWVRVYEAAAAFLVRELGSQAR